MTMTLEAVEDQIRSGGHDKARKALEEIPETDENRFHRKFLEGYLHEMSYEREEALEIYEALLEEDPKALRVAFRAATLLDQGGDDDAAIALYERCTEEGPAPLNALLNLSVLYEEVGEFKQAETNLLDVLVEYPDHHRANHFLSSVESSSTMVFDEQFQRDREQQDAMLDVPISDFELSVRARNCLRQMNIKTLGDLLRISETELLSYKNFGETSLNEIKAMLAQKDLKLGQGLQTTEQPTLPQPPSVGNGSVAHTDIHVSELELSVRSRKALQRLGVSTLGEIARCSEVDLVNIKNFGETSLVEIKQQLAKYGLGLRPPS